MNYKKGMSRRRVLKSIGLLGSGLFIAPGTTVKATSFQRKNDPLKDLGILSIGAQHRALAIAIGACNYGRMVACCDVDTAAFGAFEKLLRSHQDAEPVYYTNYRQALERKDVDIVTIGTPDHWHALMIIDALEAGKDVYVEKPLTLTIKEGIAVCEAVKRTGRIVQVGTQQRSSGIFLKAVAAAQLGLLGKKLKASVFIPSSYSRSSDELQVTEPPGSMLWEKWCGPIGNYPYIAERSHRTWRSWVETGYGPLTDWGTHHIDIAQWALGVDHTGPLEIKGSGTFPHGREKTLSCILHKSQLPNSYSTVRDYQAELKFANGNVIVINGLENKPENLKGNNGLLIEGEKNNIWVSRGGRVFDFDGDLADEIRENKALAAKIDEKVVELYKGKMPAWMDAGLIGGDLVPAPHMKNFVDCVKDRREPISDVFSQHRANSSAILAHSSMLLGRTLYWNPEKQEFVGDHQANQLLSRKYSEPYQLNF